MNKPATAVFKASGDFRNALHGVKDFFRTLQQQREYDAAERQRTKQARRKTEAMHRNKGGYYPYLSVKEAGKAGKQAGK